MSRIPDLTHSSGLSAPSRTIAPNNGQSLTINNQSQQYSGQPQFPTSMTTTNGYPTNGFATSQQTMQSTVTSIRDGMQSSQQFMSTLPVDSTQNQQPSLLKSAFTAHGSGGQVLSVPSSTQPYGFQPTSSVIPPQPPMNSVGGGTTGPQNVQFSSSNAQLSEQIYSQQSPELLPNSSSGPGTIQQMPSNLHMSGFPLTSSGNSQPNSSLLPGENSRASQHNFTPKGGIPSTPNAMQGFGSVPGPILQRTNENSAPGMPGLPARPISQNPPVGMPVPPMGTMPQNFQPGMPVPPTGSMPQNPPQPGMPVPPMGTMSQISTRNACPAYWVYATKSIPPWDAGPNCRAYDPKSSPTWDASRTCRAYATKSSTWNACPACWAYVTKSFTTWDVRTTWLLI
uniref:Protein transport protein Sec24C n=1 Tax=Heterorhabditis bacteriophora TaxID=37862 RepID=A0A1I7XDS3_HETBA